MFLRCALASLALSGLVLTATASQADETVQTTAHNDAATQAQIQQWIAAAEPVDLSDDGVNGVTVRESPRQVHGEAGVAVGTGGYRSAYVSGLFPIGETGTLGISVSETTGASRRFAGPGRGDDTRQSLSMSLALGQAANGEHACRSSGFGYGDDMAFGRYRGDPGAAALARTACRETRAAPWID